MLQELHNHPDIDLKLVVGGSILLDKYSDKVQAEVEASGFHISDKLYNVIEGGNHVAMAKTACLTALELTNSLYKLNPDVVIVDGDRFEQLAVAMAAAYLNKTIVHIEGGDVTGNIDESVRHAITKLAHIHFVTNRASEKRVLQMGENPAYVFNIGSLDVEFAAKLKHDLTSAELNKHGVGDRINIKKPFLMVMHHPTTAEENNKLHADMLFDAVASFDMPTVWFWPNNDAGTNEVAEAIRHFRENNPKAKKNFRFITNLSPEDFLALFNKATCLIGNSSSGIKESSHFGVPVVNVGGRQAGRLRGENVIDASYDVSLIKGAIKKQLKKKRYKSSDIYHQPDSSKKFVDILTNAKLYIQKKFYEV